MKKKINKIKLNLNAGKAIPNSTIGSILGQYSINIALFCKEYNNKTQLYIGLQIPVIIIFYNNKKIILNLKTPSLSFLILFYSQNNFININNIKKILIIKKKEFYPISMKKYLYTIKRTLKSINIKII